MSGAPAHSLPTHPANPHSTSARPVAAPAAVTDAAGSALTPEQAALARRRLWLGITNVGAWVLLAAGGLCWLTLGDTRRLEARALGGILAAAVAVQAVFDYLGGALLMPAPRPTGLAFLRTWSRGMLVHTLVLAGVGLLSLASFRLTGGFGPAILLGTVTLALGRRQFLGAVAGVATRTVAPPAGDTVVADAADPSFTGGLVGLGRRARSLVPAGWLDRLPQGDLAAEESRRAWQRQNGMPARALLLVLGWNLLGGFLVAHLLNLAGRTAAEALFGHACGMTLWAFAGLLVLPALSRPAVFAADHAAAQAGHDPRGWIRRFPGLVGEDGSSRSAVQTIFYPVPSAALRLRQLEQPRSGWVPGPLARSNLYYSWATLTLLGRAVHCNVGRPALWVFPPSA